MSSPAFVREPREGRKIHVVGDDITVKVSSLETDGAFAVFEARTLPLSGPPLHRHRDHDETFHILEGQYRFEVDGQEVYAAPGDVVFAPRGSVHTFQNIATTPGRTMTVVVPGGLDLFFEELEQAVPRGAAIHPDKVAPIFEKHNLELHGLPLRDRNVATASAAD